MYVGVICACMPGVRAFCTSVLKVGEWRKMHQSHERVSPSQPLCSNKSIGSGGGILQKSKKKDGFGLGTTEMGFESNPNFESAEV